MRVSTDSDTAMVLPLPVPPGTPEDAVEFVNLEEYAELFEDLEALFPALDTLDAGPISRGLAPSAAPPLQVVSVGAFEASFVPSRADFGRLDARFRLPEDVWSHLPAYDDWGFAVFKLKSGERQKIHPMAFRFPTRDSERVFFPTVHVHDGTVTRFAAFDHSLYCQGLNPQKNTVAVEVPGPDEIQTLELNWNEAALEPQETVDIERAAGLVTADAPVFKLTLMGTYVNEDTYARPAS